MNATLSLALLVAGLGLTGMAGLALIAWRRLYEGLRNEPFHREGDAVAAYFPGCSRVVLALGLLLAALGGWGLWLNR